MRWIMVWMLTAGSALADPVARMEEAAKAAFAEMPAVVIVDQIAGRCGADDGVNDMVAYCTTANEILLAPPAQNLPQTPYLLGHAYGHAVQVRHGVADLALRAIRNRPDDEAMLRGLVERQVDCIAGALVARAGFEPLVIGPMFDSDPFARVHWGRDPLRIGPVMGIGLEPRAMWFARGQSDGVAVCAPGEFSADLLLRAYRP